MNKLTEAALQYLDWGAHLLALTGKRPNPAFHENWSWENSIHGLPFTEGDFMGLEKVFTHPSTTGVAILVPPHVLVADIDTEEAAQLFVALGGDLTRTVTGRTPNGLHLWFFHPGANASQWLGGRTLLFKGFGGYVAVPPSAHFDDAGVIDGYYEWIRPYGTVFDFLPEALEKQLESAKRAAEMRPPRASEGARTADITLVEGGGLVAHQEYNIDGLCRAIREAPDGNQNNMIAWAAMQARDEGVPFDIAMKLLLEAAIEGGHPAGRARTTIKGAYGRRLRG